jgi:hypothetical protein
MDFDSMKLTELKDVARAHNLRLWSKLKKDDLIKFLKDNLGTVSKTTKDKNTLSKTTKDKNTLSKTTKDKNTFS